MIVIKNVNGHYEASEDGKFIISGDTAEEVRRDLEQMEAE